MASSGCTRTSAPAETAKCPPGSTSKPSSAAEPRSEQLLQIGVRQRPRPTVELVPARSITRRVVLHLVRAHQHVHERHRAEPLTKERPRLAGDVRRADVVSELQRFRSRVQQAGGIHHDDFSITETETKTQPSAASWPQAAAISWPRVSRTVHATPPAFTSRTNSRSTGFGDASHFDPGVGFNGITFTCTS